MSDFVALTPTTEQEPYTRNSDGYYVGTDGFVVPRNFTEFNERYPLYIRDWVRKRLFGKSDAPEIELLTANLTEHISSLPTDSIFRGMGCTDRVEVFDPNKGTVRGATGPRFFHYLKNCFNNYYLTVHQKKVTGSQGTAAHPQQPGYEAPLTATVHINEFLAFIEQHSPELLPTLKSICSEETYQDARRASGLSVQMFSRARSRLEVLRLCFESGSPVPKAA